MNISMLTKLSHNELFESIKATLVDIQSNPEVMAACLRECEDLYQERFIATITPAEEIFINIINNCTSQEEYDHEINHYLHMIFEHEVRMIKVVQKYNSSLDENGKVDLSKLYNKELQNERNRANPFYYDDQEEAELADEDYDEDYDEEYEDHLRQIALEYDYEEFDEAGFLQARPRLLKTFCDYSFVELVNYKGEYEGSAVYDAVKDHRRYVSKHNYV